MSRGRGYDLLNPELAFAMLGAGAMTCLILGSWLPLIAVVGAVIVSAAFLDKMFK
jgi:hypothetical protein